jgi:GDP-4-dehydro-6-deoxy-D-mannose reductase
VIASGKPVSIRHLLDTLIDLAGIEVKVVHDPARMRPSDTPLLYGSHEKLTRDTGWQPTIAMRTSLDDALDDWLARLEDSR